MKIRAFLLLLAMTGGATLFAQTKTVTGTVSGEDGFGIIGASVVQEGTMNGVMTSPEGTYSISVPDDAVIVISCIGYETQKLPVAGKTVIDILLKEDALLLEQATVVGYGTGSKVGTTIGTVSKVGGDKLENLPSGNVADALQGKVAGLSVMTSSGEPSEGSSIRLHGVGSISAGTSPLIVLNGVPVSEAVYNALYINDIESVNVLKDASATSIYGSRAANGVIFITTKRGQRYSEDVKILVRAQYGISQPATGKYEVLSSAQAAQYSLDNGIISQSTYNGIISSGINTNWRKYYYKSAAPTYSVDLSATGGSEKVAYYLSGSYLSKEGTAPGSGLDRFTFNSSTEIYAKKWLKMGANVVLSFENASRAYSTSNSVYNAAFMSQLSLPYDTPYNEDGSEKEMISGYYNPNYMIKTHPSSSKNLSVSGNAYIQITPVKNLNIKSQFGADAYAYWSEAYAMPSYSGSLNNGTVSRAHQNGGTFTITNTIDYNFEFSDIRHKLYLLAGQEGIRSDALSFSASRSGQILDEILLLSAGSGVPSVGDSKTRYVFNSWFGRAEYGYADKYIFDASLRRDASSRFGAKNRVGIFWSVGAMWDIKQEDFLIYNDVISSLKFKLSYGTQGNASISNYAHLSHLATTNYGDKSGLYNASEGNEELGWETQSLFTANAEIGFIDRFTLGVEFYNRVSNDLLMDVPVSATTGYISEAKNVGSMVNRGIDLTFNADIFRNKDWYVGLNATFNYNRNKMTRLFNGLTEYPLSGAGVCYAVGHDMSEFYMPKYLGVNSATGAPQWETVDKETGEHGITEDYNSATMQFIGKSYVAPFTGGFGVSARWRGLSLSADFSWNCGKYLLNNMLIFLENPAYAGTFNRSKRVLRRWEKPGDETDMPAFGHASQFDTNILEDASFLRLKNLSLSYDFPKNLITKSKVLSGVKIYFVGRNLLTATAFSGYDPEVDTNMALGDYPNSREFAAGVQFTF